ncbi:hypothetical protein JTE90_015936 [Oedothorax gibbosus]|uniref:CDK-activating kinase assembly factor MAT1 n=1 Tax=Oedothorax gibbosus TaxID=931172 RepID=A0AAV6TZ64_9ARAC|nr:hypothetical protein JTE90_015936 [Oedothorax gibbosus]
MRVVALVNILYFTSLFPKLSEAMDDLECPRCKTTKYRNPNLKLMVNVCGHALCENCVELLFVKGSAACPQCAVPLRRSNFRVQIFEDSSVEKELDIRRRVLRDFNKKESDFDTLRDYNDYLEEVETIIFNLANNVNVEATKRLIDNYKKENKVIIAKNKGKLSKEEEELEELLEREKQEEEAKREELLLKDKEEERTRRNKKEALIDDLMFSDRSAKDIIASHSQKNREEEQIAKTTFALKKRSTFSTGLKSQHVFMPVPKRNDAERFLYRDLKIEFLGPTPFSPGTLLNEGFTRHVRGVADSDVAGGFLTENACDRALQDAFCGIYFVL